MGLYEMKKQAEEHQANIELRSEKIRNIIGQVPPFLIRWGNTILILIFIVLTILFLLSHSFMIL